MFNSDLDCVIAPTQMQTPRSISKTFGVVNLGMSRNDQLSSKKDTGNGTGDRNKTRQSFEIKTKGISLKNLNKKRNQRVEPSSSDSDDGFIGSGLGLIKE